MEHPSQLGAEPPPSQAVAESHPDKEGQGPGPKIGHPDQDAGLYPNQAGTGPIPEMEHPSQAVAGP